MLQIKEQDDHIIIRELPLRKWLAPHFVTAFYFLITVYDFLFDPEKFSERIWILCLFICVGFISSYFFSNPTIIIKIDKLKKTFAIQKSTVVKQDFSLYSFAEIESVFFQPDLAKKSQKLLLCLNNGENIELSTTFTPKEVRYLEAAVLMNGRIFKPPD